MEKHPEEMYEVSSVHSDKESIAVDLLAERPEQGSNFLAYVCVLFSLDVFPFVTNPIC